MAVFYAGSDGCADPAVRKAERAKFMRERRGPVKAIDQVIGRIERGEKVSAAELREARKALGKVTGLLGLE